MTNKEENWFEKTCDIYTRLVDMGEDIKDVADYIFFLDNENKLLKEQIETLKGELKEETPKGITLPKGVIWKPERGEEFWGVDSVSNVYKDIFYGDVEGVKHINGGNCYPTKEKAEFEAQREKYTRLFRQYVEQHSEPLYWENREQEKWCVCYSHFMDRLIYQKDYDIQGLDIYGSSKEVMQEAIAFIGEENAKRYLLGVQDEKHNTD